MALTTKFNYDSLRRESTNEGRKYVAPDGSRLPSVTTILDATKSEESKKALNDWRNRIGHAKAQAITTEASSRGTRMHSWLEKYILNDKIEEPGSNPYSQQSHKMAQIVIENGLSKCQEFWGTEINLHFPKIYAGTTDLAGVHDNIDSILDFKQTNKPKKREWIEDYFLQLAAYSECHNELYGTKIRKGVILMCSATFDYQEFIIEGNDFDHYIDLWWSRVEKYFTKFL
jgi:hypothetical protein